MWQGMILHLDQVTHFTSRFYWQLNKSMSKVVGHFCFCNMFLQTSLIGYCLTKNRLCVSTSVSAGLLLCEHNLHRHCCPSPPGLIWSRYSLVIIPKNWNLFCVNFFVGGAGASQLYRIWRFVDNLHVFSCQMSEEADRLWNMNICISYRYNQDLKAQEQQKSWNGDFILGTILHLHIIPPCLHNIHAITIVRPPLAWRPCWNLVHLKFLISSGCYQNLRTF